MSSDNVQNPAEVTEDLRHTPAYLRKITEIDIDNTAGSMGIKPIENFDPAKRGKSANKSDSKVATIAVAALIVAAIAVGVYFVLRVF